MKKEYITPAIQMVMLSQLQPLAGSNDGPTGGSQQDPGLGGNSSRRRRIDWDDQWDDEEEEW